MNNASIITIGDELLIGQVIDTNSAFIAQQLNKVGIAVKRRVAVGDNWDEIWNALDEQQQHADIIIITGGLGPTADDITKPLLCKYFNGEMIVNEDVKQHVINIFTKLNRPIIERNLMQAEVPNTCEVLFNKRGTAPGMWFSKPHPTSPKGEEKKIIFISLPGVPFEMQGLIVEEVIPKLLNQFSFPHIAHRTLLTAGVGESFLAEMIKDFEEALPPHIKLAYLPNFGMVRLRLSTSGINKTEVENEVDNYFNQLQNLVTQYLVTNEDEPMEKVVAKLLLKNNKTIGTAESCTGGYISHLITAMAGSSAYYKGSVIAYAYDAKENLLGVDKSELLAKGAVSESIVTQMTQGALKNLNVDYAIAVSGIMGPGGETPDKPVGTVWIGVGNANEIVTQKLHFRFDRQRNIQLTASTALNMLRQFILSHS
ncbi:MAG: CinA family nicotinamide mononucleotide deamidase-related protein [Ferruginibacter sp.]|nr:CinA family nicotinamide mononucleotide deamidase-related protein [Ferruginibacter sp.]